MFGAGLSGAYNKSWGSQKTSKLMDTQKYGLRGMWSQYLQPYFGAADATTGGKAGERAGLGLPTYGGQLAGTYTSPVLSRLFSGAAGFRTQQPAVEGQTSSQLFSKHGGEGGAYQDPMFSHYDYFANPEERVQARLEEYRKMVAPEREKEDALMRAKMKSMGLQHSTSMLQTQSNIGQQRQAEEALMGMDLLDRYEQLGFEANESALNRMTEIGKMQTELENQGLQAQFDEWIRTQPEYNPMLQIMLQYLGLQGKEDTTTHGAGYTVKGSASYGSAQ